MANCTNEDTGILGCNPPSNWDNCRPWDLSGDFNATCTITDTIEDGLEIAGAPINIFKLLGIHEQTALTDQLSNGTPISSGDHPKHPARNAFTKYDTYWASKQTGTSVLESYIGYNFGNVKIANGRDRYAIPAGVRKNIATISIKQSPDPEFQVKRVRVERSDDGKKWYGVTVLTLSSTGALETYYFNQTVPSQFWRLRPVQADIESCKSWRVYALEMSEYQQTQIDNIQDKIWFENRDRAYSETPIKLKAYYELLSPMSIMARLGLHINTTQYQIKIAFRTCINALGRPIVVGDMLELPREAQYNTKLESIKRYLEVIDVTWDSASYTPTWYPTMLLITAQPAIASQETQDIFGDLAVTVDNMGLFSGDDGNSKNFQDLSSISHHIQNESKTEVPERGAEGSNTFRYFTEEEKAAVAPFGNLEGLNFRPKDLYVEDGIPQNGESYTEGPDYPPDPVDKQYHRLTYVGTAGDIAPRLYRYSEAKGRWIYLETDKRKLYNPTKPLMTEFLESPTRESVRKIK